MTQDILPGCGVSLREKVEASIETFRLWEQSALEMTPERGFHLSFSGGKDSVVLKRIAEMAGVRFVPVYHVTTIDPPELVQFIKRVHPDVRWSRPKRPMMALVPERGLPTRKMRWCCQEFKEQSVSGGWQATGVRAAESPRRKAAWKTVTRWTARGPETWMLAPILYWSDEDVWKFIRDQHVPYCSLYDEGFKRLGCVGCPMAGNGRTRQFARWPRYEALWRKAAHKLWNRRVGSMQRDGVTEWFGSAFFANADEMFAWWCGNSGLPWDDEACGAGLW